MLRFETLLISILIVVSGCSTKPTAIPSGGMGVSIDSADSQSTPSITDGKKRRSGYGPSVSEDEREFVVSERLPVMAVNFGPGANRTAAHITFIKSLLESKTTFHLISGSGLGAVIAAFYASGTSPDKIEWFFYKFLNKTNKMRPYSEDWRELLQEMLSKEFGSKTVEELKLTLSLPLYDVKESRVRSLKRGPLVELLMRGVTLPSSGVKGRYYASFMHEIFNKRFFTKHGADITVAVNVLGKDIKFIKWDDYLIGIFGKLVGQSQEIEGHDLVVQLPTEDLPYDGLTNFSLFMQKNYRASLEHSDDLSDKITAWKKKDKE